MVVSEAFLSGLVTVALAACAVSPVVLIILFIRESRKENLW